MAVKINNSLNNKKEEFKPINSNKVKMYDCGVTVYDHCHIGHARSLYIFEIIRRYLKYKGFDVEFVRNITDVDDKIINKAREWAKEQNISLKEAFDSVRNFYIDDYYQDLAGMRIPPADIEPKATENINEIIKYISDLREKGFAYEKEGNVYFSPKKVPGYGELSGNSLEEVLESVRIDSDPFKQDPVDFALWKTAKRDEPCWESPWGKGRPGWHIECSVMSQKYLKTDTLDIHGGGRDLIFPHHENERAQSEALTGKPFANYWIHHGLLTINGQKMSKSLGNFVTIKGFLNNYRDPDLLKLFFLSAHYAHSIDFSESKIETVKKQKKSFYDFFDRVDNRYYLESKKIQAENFKKDKSKIDTLCDKFEQAMDDDFNTARALGCLFELVDLGSKFTSSDKTEASNYVNEKLSIFFDILCLKRKVKQQISQEIVSLINQRNEARVQKDFKKADKIRAEIEMNSAYFLSDSANAVSLISKELSLD
ncbi:MAG: cysteine--tRNA ligase [Candidatus Omnitrophota bacterium]